LTAQFSAMTAQFSAIRSKSTPNDHDDDMDKKTKINQSKN